MGKEKAKDLQDIINTIELSEEQGEALTSYIAEYLNQWKGQIETKVRSEAEKALTEEYNSKAKIFEGRLRKALTEEITESLTKELSDKITADKQAEMDKKLQEALDVAGEYYASKFATSGAESIKEIEKSLVEEKSASPEVRAFREVVNSIQPFVESVDNTKLVQILESQDKTIKTLNAKLEMLNKDKTIAECLADTPEAHKESVRKFLEQASTAEEVVNKFEQAFHLIKETKDIMDGKTPEEDLSEGKKPGQDDDDDVSDDLTGLAEDEELEISDDDEFESDDEFEDEDDDFDEEVNESKSRIEDDYFEDTLDTATPKNEGADEELVEAEQKNEADAKLHKQSKDVLMERISYIAGLNPEKS